MGWKVVFTNRSRKQKIKLPRRVQEVLFQLVREIHPRNVAKIKEYARAVESGEDRVYTVDEVFPEYMGNEQPAALRAYRTREGVTQKQLASMTGIPQRHLSEMENGKRGIGKERARKLAEALHVSDYRMLL